jgi:hypothetical protein
VGGSYDDNVRLSNSAPVADHQFVADASGMLAYQDDAYSFRVSPRVLAVRYDNDKTLDRTEPSLLLQGTQSTETGETSLSFSGTQDTTLTSELGLTGLSDVNKRHRLGSLTIARSWSAAERVSVGTQLFASASRYLDAEFTGLVDYNYGSAVLNTSYDWTERSTVTVQASIGKLQVPDVAAYDKTNLAATLGYRVQLAPRWLAELSVGPSLIRTRGRAETGSVYNVSIKRNAEVATIDLSLTRDVTPNGLGLLSRRDQAHLGFTRTLTERWVTDWSATWIRTQNILPAGGRTQDAVQYADITGNLRWRMTPTWSVAVALGSTRQRVGHAQPTATRQHAALNVSWNGLAHTLN